MHTENFPVLNLGTFQKLLCWVKDTVQMVDNQGGHSFWIKTDDRVNICAFTALLYQRWIECPICPAVCIMLVVKHRDRDI